MVFKAGDRVYHPRNGAGQVTGVSRKNVSDTEIEVLDITLLETKAALSIPMPAVVKSGLRKASGRKVVEAAFSALSDRPKGYGRRQVWTKRITEFSDKINSGDPMMIAEAIRDVWLSARNGELSHTGRTIYERGRMRLSIEASDVLGGDPADHEKRIDDLIRDNPTAVKARLASESQS